MKEEALISQLRETEDRTEEELTRLRFRLEEERKALHAEWDGKEEKLRDGMRERKIGLAEGLADEFSNIEKKSSEKRKRIVTELEDRASSRIGEASRFLINRITG